MGLPAKASAPMMKALLTAALLGFLTGIMLRDRAWWWWWWWLLLVVVARARVLCTSRSGLAADGEEEVAGVEEVGEEAGVEVEPNPGRPRVAARMFSSRKRSLAAPTSAELEREREREGVSEWARESVSQ